MEQDDILAIGEGLTRILQDAPLDAIRNDPVQGAEAAALWRDLEENGFPLFAVSEASGGLGASIADVVPLAVIAGQFALPLPLIDTMLCNALLSMAGAEQFSGRMALVESRGGSRFLSHADRLDGMLLIEGNRIALQAVADCDIAYIARAEDGLGLVRSTGAGSMVGIVRPDWLSSEALRGLGAMMRSAAMSGAMQSVLELTLEHTSTREQFGRPLSKFQAIQHHLSDIASETAAATAAVSLAADSLARDPSLSSDALADIAIAKSRCGMAASVVSASAHQAHGAIGFTWEYKLGQFTRRLWQWQDEFGSEVEWSTWLGQRLLQQDSPSVWAQVSR